VFQELLLSVEAWARDRKGVEVNKKFSEEFIMVFHLADKITWIPHHSPSFEYMRRAKFSMSMTLRRMGEQRYNSTD